MTDETLYVYAVVPADTPAPSVTGIDGRPLRLITAPSGLAAVVHPHESGPYEGPDEDVKRWVLQHSDVVEDCWTRAASVLPVSFNVIVRASEETGDSPEEQLKRWLTETKEELHQKLEELAGTSELRVEIILDQHEFSRNDDQVLQLTAEMESRPAGVRRLLQKRLEKLEKQLTDRAADDLYPTYRSRVAARSLQLQEYTSSQRPAGTVPVLSAACLVSSERIRDLGAELTSIQEETPEAQIRFLGPWPPYSFVDFTAPQA